MEDGHVQAVLDSHISVAQQNILRRGQNKALEDWFVAGHPNWRVWEGMTHDGFMRGMHTHVTAFPPL
jgi:hypothetical protein